MSDLARRLFQKIWSRTVALAGLPAARYRWAAAEDARREKRWVELVEHVEALHRLQWCRDESRFLLGSGYAKLWRLDEAVAQLSSVKRPLRNQRAECERLMTLAWCYYGLCQPENARNVLSADAMSQLPPGLESTADQLQADGEQLAKFHRDLWPDVRAASEAQDWERLIELIEPLHASGTSTSITRLLAAEAYAANGRWHDSLRELDGIAAPLPEAYHSERQRWVRALDLHMIGETSDLDELLADQDSECPDWIAGVLNRDS